MARFDPVTKKFYCECQPDCNEEIPFYNTYKSRHYFRSAEAVAKVIETQTGLIHSDEWRENQSKGMLRAIEEDSSIVTSRAEAMLGLVKTPEHCANLSKSITEWWASEAGEARRTIQSEQYTGRIIDEIWRQHLSEGQTNRWKDLNEIEQQSKAHLGIPLSEWHKEAISIGQRDLWFSMSEEERNEAVEIAISHLRGQSCKPNMSESYLDGLLQSHFPNTWKYSGNGEIVIGGRIPDFTFIEGKKAVIELFGHYWHDEDNLDDSNPKSEAGTIRHYSKFGYSCLVVWIDSRDDIIFEWPSIDAWIKAGCPSK